MDATAPLHFKPSSQHGRPPSADQLARIPFMDPNGRIHYSKRQKPNRR